MSISNPMVSVVVLTYNQEQTIGRTLDSILSQKSDYSFEIIVGEDASPSDNTRAVCEAYAAKHPQLIRLLPKTPNKGLMRNYADCLAECSGKYIACCAGDDWWHNPNKLQMQVNFLEANADYGVIYTDFDVYNTINGRVRMSYNKTKNFTPPSGDIYKTLLRGNTLAAGTVMFQKSIYDQCVDIEMFKKRGFMMEDYPMWLSMSVMTKFKYMDESTFSYSLNDGSASNNGTDIEKTELFEDNIMLIKEFFIDKYPVDGYTVEIFKMARYSSLFNSSITYNLPKYARRYAWQIVKLKPSFKNVAKVCVCYIPYFFDKYRQRLS